MLHRVLTAMAAALCVLVISGSAFAHPNYPGLSQGHSGKSAQGVERKSVKAKRTGGANHLAIARRYIGTNPTRMRRLWCARFLGLVLEKAGRPGTGSNLAKSYARYGTAVSRSAVKPGDIAVLTRRGGGHVGIVASPPKNGKVVLVSGNSGGGGPGRRVVTEQAYDVSRVIAWRRVS